MSLLLDALKKAADDKQKASHSGLSEEGCRPGSRLIVSNPRLA